MNCIIKSNYILNVVRLFMKQTLYNLTHYNLCWVVKEPHKSKFTVLVNSTSLEHPIVGKSPSYYVFHLCSFPIILLTRNISEADVFFFFGRSIFSKDNKIREKWFHTTFCHFILHRKNLKKTHHCSVH